MPSSGLAWRPDPERWLQPREPIWKPTEVPRLWSWRGLRWTFEHVRE